MEILPSKKSSAIIPIKKSSAIIKADKFFGEKKEPKISQKTTRVKPSNQKILQRIEKKVIKIDKILKDSLLFQKKETEKKRKEGVDKSFAEKEKEFEKKKPKQEKSPIKLPSPPGLGLFDIIKNYIGNVIFGFFAVRLIDFLPTLLGVVPHIISVTDFITDLGGTFLNGLVTFVDWGYKAIDGTRQFIKDIGGEGLAQNFDKFAGAIDNLIEVAIITALATADSDRFGGGEGLGGGRGGRPGKGGAGPGGGFRQTGGKGGRWQGLTYSRILDEKGIKRSLDQSDNAIMKRYFQRFGKDAFIERFGQEGLKRLPGGMQRGLLQRGARSAFVGLAGKGGAKAILGTIRPLLKRLPIIGALIDFGLSVALGEDPGRAAFKAIGAGLLGSVGAAIGSVVPIAGNLIGGIVGGVAGDAIGGALYDMFFGGKKPKQSKVKGIKAAGGGQASTRGGKPVTGPAKRTIKKTPVRIISVKPKEVNPGASIGGKEKIQKIFPEPTISEEGKTVDPYGYMKSSSDKLSETFGFGGLFSLITKAQLGDKPSKNDYQSAAQGLMAWMQTTFSSQILRTGGAFAEGGEVDASMFNYDQDMKNVVAKSIEESVSSKVDATISDLMKQLMLKDMEKDQTTPKPDPSLQTEPGGVVTGGNADFWALVAIASLESGTPQGRADVAQSIYNRLASGIYSGNTIKELIVSGNGRQYQPVGRAVNEFRSISDKESAINAIMVANKLNRSQAEKFINDTASAIQNKQLQESAAQFVGGRTDFWAEGLTPPADGVGYVVRNGHRFGWFVGPAAIAYGRKNPGPAKAPSLGDIVVMGGTNIALGEGYGSAGSKIAGELGRFMKKKGVVPGSIHRHPEHPPYSLTSGHSKGSLHYQGRAIDLGGYANEQGPILAAVAEFNRLKGVKPVQLLHAGNEPSGHSDHVHVAYEKGGKVGGLTKALLGEKGSEFVIDADSTRALEDKYPGFLNALNKANYTGAINILQSYASYEFGSETIIMDSDDDQEQDQTASSGYQPVMIGGGGSVNSDMQFEDSLMYG